MKTKKYFLLSVAVSGILCLPAFGEIESFPKSEMPVLIGQVNPALSGIDKLLLIVAPADGKPERDGLVWKGLETKIRQKLEEAGLKTILNKGGGISSIPELRVYIEMLKLTESNKYVFRTETTLATESQLKDRNLYFKAEVWWSRPVMAAVEIRKMPSAVSATVEGQVEEFIASWAASNQPSNSQGAVNEGKPYATGVKKPEGKAAVSEHQYVASKKSRVFHKVGCSSAKRIKAENVVGYAGRDDAIKAGKKPCRRCKP